MKRNTSRWSFLALIATLTGASFTAQAQTGGEATASTPNNLQLLDKLIAKAKPGDNFVKSGDMLLPLDKLKAYREAQSSKFGASSNFEFGVTLWPGGRVPYVIDAAFPADARAYFEAACREWEKHANLKFFPRTTETNYIRVFRDPAGGSYSHVGMIGGAQDFSLASWADQITAAHELAHALGVMHEHTRSDRDNYVTIDFSNIIAGEAYNYAILPDSNNRGNYDFHSVMHYAPITNFNIDPSRPNIICKPGYTQFQNTMGRATQLSLLDKKGMAEVYGAPVTTAPSNNNFASATTLTGTSGSVNGSTIGATRESGEPVHVLGVNSTASVWYKWTPASTGVATFNTSGSNYDTLISVYTGTSLTQLSKVVSNDDATSEITTSTVSFEARAGTTYYIAVDGYNSVEVGQLTGNIVLKWNQVVPVSRFTIGGVVKDNVGNPLSGVTINLTGGSTLSTTTSSTGAYSFTNQASGSYTITPSRTNTSFSPTSRTITLSAASPANDFVGTVRTLVAAPRIFISDVAVREGNSGRNYVTFTVYLNKPSATPISVSFTTSNGTALNTSDYVGRTGTINFPANVVSIPFTVFINPDAISESNEYFNLNLSNPIGASIGDSNGRATIINDDPTGVQQLPAMSVGDIFLQEGNAGSSYVTFNVMLNQPSATTITASYATSNVNALSGSDYVARSGTITFAPNVTAVTVKVPLLPDTQVETNESFSLNVFNLVGATIADGQGRCTLANDDVAIASDAGPTEATVAPSSPSSSASGS